jgi:hypothetical protein
VPHFLTLHTRQWSGSERQEVLRRIRNTFSDNTVIVRSSASSEDGNVTSHAGAFLSVPNVSASDREHLQAVIDDVIASYTKRCIPSDDDGADDQVIIQRMIERVSLSGVLFTQDPSTGAPYYVINYDDQTGSTDAVTSGTSYHNRTLYVYRDAVEQLSSPRFARLLRAVQEIEALVDSTSLDIEFALDHEWNVEIFQVRRITTPPASGHDLPGQIGDALSRVSTVLRDRCSRGEQYADGNLLGRIFGGMPDWNPAEMIGTTPLPLAYSLYRKLITERAWRVARGRMGYKQRSGVELMVSLAGQPYIDVAESFHSYLPAVLPDEIGAKLVRAWLGRLRHNHHLHDKIEFDVAVTVLTPDFSRRAEHQFPDALTATELDIFKRSLRTMTNRLLRGEVASIDDQRRLIDRLARHRHALVHRSAKPSLDAVSTLLDDAIEHGTIPFAILARHGFIATSFLMSLASEGALSQERVDTFLRTIPTVAGELINDLRRVACGEIAEEAVIDKYGHLRPGTYDILSLRYDRRKEMLRWMPSEPDHAPPVAPFELTRAESRAIEALLSASGLAISVDALFTYITQAIQGREYAKFVFTHNVSDALEILAAWGHDHGLSRQQLSYLDITDILNRDPHDAALPSDLQERSDRGRRQHAVTHSLRLPFLITRLSDLVIVPLQIAAPNYVTRKRVKGQIARLTGTAVDPSVIDHRIVAIECADPGFDWIFARPVLGLVTKYGGINSHMAIRCAEFGLPAAIGCGEQVFDRIVKSSQLCRRTDRRGPGAPA